MITWKKSIRVRTSLTCDQAILFFGGGWGGGEKIRLIQLFVNSSASVFFVAKKQNKKINNTLLGGSTVFKFGGFTPKGIICNFMIGLNVHCTFVVALLCDLAFWRIGILRPASAGRVGSFQGFSLRIQELGRIKRSAKTARKVGKHLFSVYSYIDCRLTFQTVKISLLKWCPFCDLLYLPARVNLVRLWVSGSIELTGSNAWLTLEEGYVIDNSYGPLSPRLYN